MALKLRRCELVWMLCAPLGFGFARENMLGAFPQGRQKFVAHVTILGARRLKKFGVRRGADAPCKVGFPVLPSEALMFLCVPFNPFVVKRSNFGMQGCAES